MKRCYVRISTRDSWGQLNKMKWVKGRLISHHKDADKYEVKYRDGGPCTGFFMRPDSYSEAKPEELVKVRPEYVKRSIWPKIIFSLLYAFIGYAFLTSSAYDNLHDWQQMLIVFFHWTLYISSINIIERVIKAEIRQEEIHKSLTEKE